MLTSMTLSTLKRSYWVVEIELEKRITEITCFNPECSNRIKTTIEQKRDFLISFALKYDATVLPTCSKECAEKLLSILGDYEDIARKAEEARLKMRKGKRSP